MEHQLVFSVRYDAEQDLASSAVRLDSVSYLQMHQLQYAGFA